MLYTIVVILVVLWALGFFLNVITSPIIHVLLVIALIVLVYQLVTGNRAV